MNLGFKFYDNLVLSLANNELTGIFNFLSLMLNFDLPLAFLSLSPKLFEQGRKRSISKFVRGISSAP